MESVEKPVELQNVRARVAEKSELRRLGRLLNEGCDFLRGNVIREVFNLVPEEIDLLVYA